MCNCIKKNIKAKCSSDEDFLLFCLHLHFYSFLSSLQIPLLLGKIYLGACFSFARSLSLAGEPAIWIQDDGL